MGRYFLFSGLLLLASHFAGVDVADMHAGLADALAEHRKALWSGGLLAGFALVGAAFLFGMMGLFNIMFAVTRLFHEAAKALLCAVSLGTLLFGFVLDVDFLLVDARTLLMVLYFWLYGTALALRVFDFNYPVREMLVAYTALPFFCLLLIRISVLFR
jgi:hypothetical protein